MESIRDKFIVATNNLHGRVVDVTSIAKELVLEIDKLTAENSELKLKLKSIEDLIMPSESPINTDSSTRDDEFDEFWHLYDKKIGVTKCLSKFRKLTNKEVGKILQVLPDYIASTPDVTFRKHPLTWLNGKHWNDSFYHQPPKKYVAPQKRTVCTYKTAGYISDKCEQNRAVINMSDEDLLNKCLSTTCNPTTMARAEIPLALHSKGYSITEISKALFGSESFLSGKVVRKESRYRALTTRMINILPNRPYPTNKK